MSKQVKQMQMDVLAKTFRGVKDMVFLTAQGVDSITDNKIRLGLRKKNISLMMVKNSLLRRVFEGKIDPGEVAYVGSTLIAWGGDSIKELSERPIKTTGADVIDCGKRTLMPGLIDCPHADGA